MKLTIFAALCLAAFSTLAPPCFAKDQKGKNAPKESEDDDSEAKDGERKGRWVRLRTGTYDLTLQPVEINAVGGNYHPSFEFLYAKPRLGTLPVHLGVAYWGIEQDSDDSGGGEYLSDDDYYTDDEDQDTRYERQVHYSLHGVVARAKLFFSPGFFMNFGFGYRYTRTREVQDYPSTGRRSLFKEAASLGGAIGIGNRFYIGQTYYIGANWLELFIPVRVLKGRDAEDGDDGHNYSGDTKKHDGMNASFRTLGLELGRLF